MRADGRSNEQTRDIKITTGFTMHAEGSVLIEMGGTKVICNATVEEKVPPFLIGKGEGWVTAEYAMLPRATNTRNSRDITKLKQNARSVEIQRLIARALRMAVDLKKLGERTVIIDCDVIQADGGTRTASISGGFVALHIALQKLCDDGILKELPIQKYVSAVSVGVVGGEVLLDLCYEEDSRAEVDMNVIMDSNGEFVEIQGTGENSSFSQVTLMKMLDFAKAGNTFMINEQRKAIHLIAI